MPNSRMQDRVLETYARSLMEAAKAEDRVFRDLNELEIIANAAPEVIAVIASLFERGQLDLLPQIVATFKEMTEEDEDVVGVTVTTAVPLDDELRRYSAVKNYLASLAALIASIIIGTTLNRSPQMP